MAVYTIQYSGETITTPDLPASMTQDQIKQQCVSRWPELANATMNVEGNNISFTLRNGTKA